jgi:hypothetical protein
MLNKTVIAMASVGALLITFSSSDPYVAVGSEAQASEHDCRNTCNDCQKSCQSIPAGSKQTDCMRACTSTAAGCCAGDGKKPPQGLSCACM